MSVGSHKGVLKGVEFCQVYVLVAIVVKDPTAWHQHVPRSRQALGEHSEIVKIDIVIPVSIMEYLNGRAPPRPTTEEPVNTCPVRAYTWIGFARW
jgi:hypothetical protein